MENAKLLRVAILSAGIGVPAAFFTIALPAMMRDGGSSLMAVGLIYLVWLPSVAKWLWSPWVEARSATGAARVRLVRWLSFSLALCFLPVAWLADHMAITGLIALSIVSAALGLTIQLVIAGWSMSSLPDQDRAKVNGCVAGGMIAGGVFGGGIAPWLAAHIGWLPVVASMAVTIAATGLAGGVLQTGSIPETTPVALKLRNLVDVFSGPKGTRLLKTVLVLTAAGSVDMTLTARLIDAGYSMTQAALLLGTVATVLMIPASLFAGGAIARVGAVKTCKIICVVKALVLLTLALPFADQRWVIGGFAVLEFMLAAALTVVTWQIYMADHAPGKQVVGFAALTSCDAMMRITFGLLAGALGAQFGTAFMFGAVAMINLVAAIWITQSKRQPQTSH